MPHELASLAAFIKPTLLDLSNKGHKSLSDDQTMTTLQLISVFHSLDKKGENALAPEQVKEALILIGIAPREKVMNKYFSPVRVGEKQMPAIGQSVRRSSQALEKVTKRFEVPKTIDMNKFIETTLGELESKQFDYDFATLFALLEAQETLPLRDLKHLLVGTKSPLKLNLKEFEDILDALEVGSEARRSLQGSVNCKDLIAKLLLPQQLLMKPLNEGAF